MIFTKSILCGCVIFSGMLCCPAQELTVSGTQAVVSSGTAQAVTSQPARENSSASQRSQLIKDLKQALAAAQTPEQKQSLIKSFQAQSQALEDSQKAAAKAAK